LKVGVTIEIFGGEGTTSIKWTVGAESEYQLEQLPIALRLDCG
jgi:hypothetical protein